MQVTFDIPDTLAEQLRAAGKDPAHAALEALSVSQLAEDYQRLLDLAAEASVEEAIRQGREDIAAGRTYPAREVFAAMRRKYRIPKYPKSQPMI
jgi:predicted transcriptional regulator